ncbi:Vacuolar amino acid permease [Mycena chlorophos]|uniref:Vacuolar amino acid permease n=1 Tax=Mycena chlorophos TaxID=658473 RepID=A0A8H6SAC6_MYCCL|nr:Vacuolar amino acid permease [Mycena chlorophos]
MSAAPTERDPLLRKPAVQVDGVPSAPDPKRRLGPLELSASQRRRALVGGVDRGVPRGEWLRYASRRHAEAQQSLNMSLVPTMMPSISSEFQKFHQAQWLGTAYVALHIPIPTKINLFSYLLATCTFTPLYGRLSNVMGRRGANLTAICFTAAGTIGCGLSTSMEGLIAARFLAGIGGGGLFTTSSIIVSDMYTLRGLQAVSTASVLPQLLHPNLTAEQLGMGLGGPFGGVVTDLFGWRAAFVIQTPLFVIAALMTQFNITYSTPGKSKGTKEVLKRIDYFGSLTLLVAVGSLLVFLSSRYNESLPLHDPRVLVPLILAVIFFLAFLVVEIFVAPEPVMAPALLRQKVPVLVSASNFLVAACNFSVTYFFPMWFQVVTLESASTAGLHLMPNSVSMSTGAVFAGWVMHRMGRYKLLNLVFGFFPFLGATLISFMREDSGPIQSWLSIIPLGFGNAVVLQTMLIALLAHLPESQMAVGTGFGQLFRGIGQVGGVAISSAIFQTKLDHELRKRFPAGSDKVILAVRRSSAVIRELVPEEQRWARDAYAISLRTVYIFAATSTLMAYIVRLPIPDQDLDKAHAKRRQSTGPQAAPAPAPATPTPSQLPPGTAASAMVVAVAGPSSNGTRTREAGPESDDDDDSRSGSVTPTHVDPTPNAENGYVVARPRPMSGTHGRHPRRRLSGFEDTEGGMDLESDVVGGSARSVGTLHTRMGEREGTGRV